MACDEPEHSGREDALRPTAKPFVFARQGTTMDVIGGATFHCRAAVTASCRPLYFGHAAARGLRIPDRDETVAPASTLNSSGNFLGLILVFHEFLQPAKSILTIE